MAVSSRTVGQRRKSGRLGRLLMVVAGMLVAGLAGAPIAYVLWPQAAPIAPDAPSLPITVGGELFNVPPAAIRFSVQRRPGAQARIDLNFLWPSLQPPDARIRPLPNQPPEVTDRLFVTIAVGDGTLPPLERLKLIYPRYAAGAPLIGRDGLSVQSFGNGTAYQGEDLVYDPAVPERFLLRCSRPAGATPAMCLHERRIGGADLTVRFPRAWLANWRATAEAIDALIRRLHAAGR